MVSNKKNSNNKMDSKDEEDDIPKITPLYSKILVTTDKNWDNKVVIRSTLEEISQQIGCIILREGRGTKCIRPVCYKFGIRNISYIADWAKFGYKAGVLRNEEMIEKGNPSLVIIFHNWIEYGTGIDHLIFLCKLIAYLSVIPAIKSAITLSLFSFLNNLSLICLLWFFIK